MTRKFLLAACLAAALPAGASAAVVSLNFEGITPYPSFTNPQIGEFYNGGVSGAGTTGTNYGVSFSSNAILIELNTTTTATSNTSRGGQGDPNSQLGALFFLTGSQTYLNYSAGFTTGFSFNYTAINVGGSIGVYDGLNGTGNLLTSLALPTTPAGPCPGYNAGFCPFVPLGVAFNGTARSIDFGGVANQIVFDDITFGSVRPGPGPIGDPEPATLVLLGAGLLGLGAARRRSR